MEIKRFLPIVFCLAAFVTQAQVPDVQLIPAPVEMTKGAGTFTLDEKTILIANPHSKTEAEFFAAWLSSATGKKFEVQMGGTIPSSNFIFFNSSQATPVEKTSAEMIWLPSQSGSLQPGRRDREGYNVSVSEKFIGVTGITPVGVFYGVQTLRQLLPSEAEKGALKLPVTMQAMTIKDYPKFGHRGLMLDCCRHFMSKEFVKKTIDVIAQYKMNVLHWHLTEDQGWRIQIDSYPELTNIGAWRTEEDGTRYGGFYTKEDIREIVAYAEARHITIIPEIELPGHSVAAIASYPEISCTGLKIPVENEWGVFKDIYCAGNEKTFEFLEAVLTEVCELFPGPYIHIGGDEAPKFRWENCSKCQHRIEEEGLEGEAGLQTYFIERIAKFLATKDKQIIGWDEILEGGIPSSAVIQSWRDMEGGREAARQHHLAIMSPTSHCYLDYPLTSIDVEKIYSFDPIPDSLNEKEKSYIIGGECNMWTEHVTEQTVNQRIFPRLLAMSEVLWSYPDERNYDEFEKRLDHQYTRLDAQDIAYGFPAIPYTLTHRIDKLHQIVVTLDPGNDVEMSYQVKQTGTEKVVQEGKSDSLQYVIIKEPSQISLTTTWKNKKYEEITQRTFYPHAGFNQDISLSYVPSRWYTGGGTNALVDGVLGTTNFRDGLWQAVAGTNMEVVVNMYTEKEITHLSSNWFHYGNAWIFRPSHVAYFVSEDGKEWKQVADVQATVDEKAKGELITTMEARFEKTKALFVKMVAYNTGPCPAWHDAAGEPSWLFCDELIVE